MQNFVRFAPMLELPTLWIAIAMGLLTWILIPRLHSVYLGPLSKFPGPKVRAFTSAPKILTLVRGREQSDYIQLHAKYGAVVRVAPNELSFAGGAQAWRDVLGFKKSGTPGLAKDLRFYAGEMFKPRTNCFLANADDQEHSKLRRVISHAFADKSLRDVEPMLLHWASKLKAKLGEQVPKGPADMVRFYNCTTFDIMGDLAFNEDLGMLAAEDENEWVKDVFRGIKHSTFVRAIRNAGAIGWWFIDVVVMDLPQAVRGVRRTLEYSNSRLQRRINRVPDRPDLFTQILAKGVGPQHLDQAEHQGLAFFFMVAGTETTASAVSGITFYLLTHPKCLEQFTNEVRTAFSSLEDVTLQKLTQLKYTTAVIQEGLRMYPPVPIALPRRSPPGGAVIDGTFIPGNVTCGVHHMGTYRQAEHFTDPNEFHPERWLGDPKYKDDHLDAVEPFHVGPRNCVGKNLAWHEMRLLLVTTLLHYDLELTKECEDWMLRNEVYTVWQKPPLLCRLKPKQAA